MHSSVILVVLFLSLFLKVTAKTLSQHDELMKKTETMNVLVETNKMLREEKERLEQELQQAQAKVNKKRQDNPLLLSLLHYSSVEVFS